ncbi:MAG: hypothetical protein E7525_01495 [Ruminococcaceae bacterium]|nr:hypothetical protein [Oscillospiraceae bacterium]
MKLSKSLKRIMAVVLAVMMLASVCAVSVATASAATYGFEGDKGILSLAGSAGDTAYSYVTEGDNTVVKITNTATAETDIGIVFGTTAGVTALESDSVYTVSFKYKLGAGTQLQKSNKHNTFERLLAYIAYADANNALTSSGANCEIKSPADPAWVVEPVPGSEAGEVWFAQNRLAADTAWATAEISLTTPATLENTTFALSLKTFGNATVYIDDVTVAKVRTVDYGTTTDATLTLDFENGAGIATTNTDTDPEIREYVADPEDPDNTVFHVSFEQPEGKTYTWQAGIMFGNSEDAVVDNARDDAFTLVAGRTYTVSFRYKIGAGTTFDLVTDGPDIEGFEDEFYFEDLQTGNVATKMDYRNYMRMTFVKDTFALGGNQAFGTRMDKTVFPDNDSLLQTYWSEQLYDEWYNAMYAVDYDSENMWPFYIRKSENDTPWIDYTYTFTATDDMNNTKLGLNIVPGNGILKDADSGEIISDTHTYFSYSYYIDDVVINYEADAVKFGDETVAFEGNKVTVPNVDGYYLDIDGNKYAAGDVVEATDAYYNFTAIEYAPDKAFAVRDIDLDKGYTTGLRARGAFTADEIANASEIGFAIIPKRATDLKGDWFAPSAYIKHVAIDSEKYADAVTVTGEQYQICLTGLNDLTDEEFIFATYKVVNGVTTYKYIGCQSYNTVKAALGQ